MVASSGRKRLKIKGMASSTSTHPRKVGHDLDLLIIKMS